MNKIDFKSMGNVGFRFLIFRKAIRKSQMQIADEVSVPLTEIQSIENGSSFPEIEILHNMNIEYGLNINWLLFNEGEMFSKECLANLDANFVMMPLKEGVEEIVARHTGFILLMQIPIIEKAMLDRLEELKLELQKNGSD